MVSDINGLSEDFCGANLDKSITDVTRDSCDEVGVNDSDAVGTDLYKGLYAASTSGSDRALTDAGSCCKETGDTDSDRAITDNGFSNEEEDGDVSDRAITDVGFAFSETGNTCSDSTITDARSGFCEKTAGAGFDRAVVDGSCFNESTSGAAFGKATGDAHSEKAIAGAVFSNEGGGADSDKVFTDAGSFFNEEASGTDSDGSITDVGTGFNEAGCPGCGITDAASYCNEKVGGAGSCGNCGFNGGTGSAVTDAGSSNEGGGGAGSDSAIPDANPCSIELGCTCFDVIAADVGSGSGEGTDVISERGITDVGSSDREEGGSSVKAITNSGSSSDEEGGGSGTNIDIAFIEAGCIGFNKAIVDTGACSNEVIGGPSSDRTMGEVSCGFDGETHGAGSERAITDSGSPNEAGGDAGFDEKSACCIDGTGNSDDEAAGASLTRSGIGSNGINVGGMTPDKVFDKVASLNASGLGRSETGSNNFT